MKRHRLTYSQLTALVFFLIILCGAVLLTLPISSVSGSATPFLSSLFTATSATCVTGLVVFDTFEYWSVFGKAIILLLIQIGGIGFMSVMTFFSMAIGRKISLSERVLLKENYNTPELSGMVKITRSVIKGTFFFELSGALLLSVRLIPEHGIVKGVLTSLFTSVSAFCNAGFDLFGENGAYSSLTSYQNDPLVILTVSSLIIIGGLGFLVWSDIKNNKHHVSKYRVQSKIVLTATAFLLVSGTVLFLIFEKDYTNKNLDYGGRVLNSFFDAVTPRTAGFNSVDTASLSPAGKVLSVLLMFIGGSPGSTAGGIKTVTVVILFLTLASELRKSSGINAFGKRIPNDAINTAQCIAVIYFIMLSAGVLLISAFQPEFNISDIVFECASALSTVGMTTGITRDTNSYSRAVLILLMYFGRVGSLSFAMVFSGKKKKSTVMYPTEKVSV